MSDFFLRTYEPGWNNSVLMGGEDSTDPANVFSIVCLMINNLLITKFHPCATKSFPVDADLLNKHLHISLSSL